jgi:hypothetical protein
MHTRSCSYSRKCIPTPAAAAAAAQCWLLLLLLLMLLLLLLLPDMRPAPTVWV